LAEFAFCGNVYHDSVGIAHDQYFDMLSLDLLSSLFCAYDRCGRFYPYFTGYIAIHCVRGHEAGALIAPFSHGFKTKSRWSFGFLVDLPTWIVRFSHGIDHHNSLTKK
jgi:hypothetical protein